MKRFFPHPGKLFFLLSIAFCFSFPLLLPAQSLQFLKGISGITPRGGGVLPRSIKVDGAGNTYVTGSFYLTSYFDLGDGVASLITAGLSEGFFAKYDAAMEPLSLAQTGFIVTIWQKEAEQLNALDENEEPLL